MTNLSATDNYKQGLLFLCHPLKQLHLPQKAPVSATDNCKQGLWGAVLSLPSTQRCSFSAIHSVLFFLCHPLKQLHLLQKAPVSVTLNCAVMCKQGTTQHGSFSVVHFNSQAQQTKGRRKSVTANCAVRCRQELYSDQAIWWPFHLCCSLKLPDKGRVKVGETKNWSPTLNVLPLICPSNMEMSVTPTPKTQDHTVLHMNARCWTRFSVREDKSCRKYNIIWGSATLLTLAFLGVPNQDFPIAIFALVITKYSHCCCTHTAVDAGQQFPIELLHRVGRAFDLLLTHLGQLACNHTQVTYKKKQKNFKFFCQR